MKTNPTFLITIISLTAVGSWGVWKIIEPNFNLSSKQTVEKAQIKVSSYPKQTKFIKLNNENTNGANKDLQKVKALLAQNNASQAITYVSDLYNDLDSEQLSLFKQLFYTQALQYSDNGQLKQAQRFLIQVSRLYEEVDFFDLLAAVSIELNDLNQALDALLKSSLIETRPDILGDKLASLANTASQIKSQLSAISSFEGIRKLYQSLYEAHPSYAYFQLELAFSYLSLDDTSNAQTFFSAIQYDLDVGAQAQEQLALLEQINQQEQQAAAASREELKAKQAARNAGDISISLVRSGNSFLIDSSIENKNVRLLLDTGASITALSPELISRLRLSPTGDVINLSTANGIAQSQLYLAKKINIGRITVRDLVVAEINLGSSRHFEGLLGTDLLNKVGANYSYLIDNENNALIFRRRSR